MLNRSEKYHTTLVVVFAFLFGLVLGLVMDWLVAVFAIAGMGVSAYLLWPLMDSVYFKGGADACEELKREVLRSEHEMGNHTVKAWDDCPVCVEPRP